MKKLSNKKHEVILQPAALISSACTGLVNGAIKCIETAQSGNMDYIVCERTGYNEAADRNCNDVLQFVER